MTTTKKMLEVVIDRTRWLRGTGDGTLLRQKEGNPDYDKMCCLGFAARAAGMTKKEIANRGGISDCVRRPRALLGLFELPDGLNNDDLEGCLMSANDDQTMNDKFRESHIIKLGKKAGILFSFIGKTARKQPK